MNINDSSLIGFGDPCTHKRVLKMDIASLVAEQKIRK